MHVIGEGRTGVIRSSRGHECQDTFVASIGTQRDGDRLILKDSMAMSDDVVQSDFEMSWGRE